ncbi:MAG: MOSC domain-containing protein [Cocleimonas sp.]|nr:MOSC domain-containing protein [Cocleimonas sp.]
MAKQITVSSLYIYPVKSLAGIKLESTKLDSMGLQYDRRWMLVSPAGDFLSQRKVPKMALIQPQFVGHQLILTLTGREDFGVPDANPQQTMQVNIWKDTVTAQRVGKLADEWLSEALEVQCHLVYIPEDEIRQCDPAFSRKGDRTGFADGFPILLISTASLDDLNQRLKQRVKMRRFRPNIVVSGCDAFAEDSWYEFTLGKIAMRGVKPCSRCILTTVDPTTGKRSGDEPLHTLMQYRKQGNNVYFGQNVIPDGSGTIRIGSSIFLDSKN